MSYTTPSCLDLAAPWGAGNALEGASALRGSKEEDPGPEGI